MNAIPAITARITTVIRNAELYPDCQRKRNLPHRPTQIRGRPSELADAAGHV
tara:strand:- start:96 stop:251 length:156 start_codon:yes stop_codon:yes gene_type:complete